MGVSSGHGHDHGPSVRAGARHLRPLATAFVLTIGFLVVQVIVGLITGSLALLSDAGHMATDALGLGMALAAIHAASHARTDGSARSVCTGWRSWPPSPTRCCCSASPPTCSYSALSRFGDPPEIEALPVLVVGGLGLVVNLIAFTLLRGGRQESLNVGAPISR